MHLKVYDATGAWVAVPHAPDRDTAVRFARGQHLSMVEPFRVVEMSRDGAGNVVETQVD